MLVNHKITEIYEEIRNKLFYMIPEKWESIYLYATVIPRGDSGETGEMFFYYFPTGILKKNPVNVYQIPQRFNIEEEQYVKLSNELYYLIKELRRAYVKYEKTAWSNITISIKNASFLATYNCEDLLDSKYTGDDRLAIWQYKYLEFPLEKFDKEQRNKIQEYIKEEKMGLHEAKTYEDSFYKPHVHNNIHYNIERNNEEYIQEEKEEEKIEEKIEEDKIVVRNQILNME